MPPPEAHPSREVCTLTLRSYQKSESDLPPYPLAQLLLVVESRTQSQGLSDRPVTRSPFCISGLLKPEYTKLSTNDIRASHISFDSFCQRVERAFGIKFDAARDELGWVQEPLSPDEEQQCWGISSELTFQNALGLLRAFTTQSEPPSELILHLWSPAAKEPIFRRSRRAPIPKAGSVKVDPQQSLGPPMQLVIRPPLEQSAYVADPLSPLGTNPVPDQSKGGTRNFRYE